MATTLDGTMFTVTVQLEHTGLIPDYRRCEAWFLPSLDTASWMGLLSRSASRGDAWSCYLAPAVGDVTRASGLIVLPHEQSDQISPLSEQIEERSTQQSSFPADAPFAEGVPLICIHSKSPELWIPACARLSPPVGVERLMESLAGDSYTRYVWLPSCGLVGLEPLDRIDPALLLVPPEPWVSRSSRDAEAWIRPPEPVTNLDRIQAVRVSTPPDLSDLFGEEQGAIGAQSGSLMDLNGPRESAWRSALGKMFRSLLSKLNRRATEKKKTDELSSGSRENSARKGRPAAGRRAKAAGGTSSFAEKFGAGWMRMLGSALQQEREKQLEKLLSYFAFDPDKASQFAIPMAQSAPRGLESGGANLSAGNVDFSMKGLLGGGQVGNPWTIPEEMHRRLQEAYRAQAARELAAGRYRRAAYIYAHLLGELDNAASVLERGGFYVEAAALYGEVLRRPRDQARCLAIAGQFADAAEVYERLHDHTAAGELWEKIGEPEKAAAAYRRSVDYLVSQRDVMQAADLLDMKLGLRDEAEMLLWSMWPEGAQSVDCARRAFKWLGEARRHDAAAERLEQVVRDSQSSHQYALATLALHLFREYPDAALRLKSEDHCRAAVARALARAGGTADDCMDILRCLHPKDKVLRRDTRRFVERQRVNEIRLKPSQTSTGGDRLVRLPQPITLPGHRYFDAMMNGASVASVCWSTGHLQGCSSFEEGAVWKTTSTSLLEMPRPDFSDIRCAFRAKPSHADLYVGLRGMSMDFPERELRPRSGMQNVIKARPFSYISTGSFAVTLDDTVWWIEPNLQNLISYSDGLRKSFSLAHSLRQAAHEWSLTGESLFSDAAGIEIVSVGLNVYFSIGRTLFECSGGRIALMRTFDTPIRSISTSLPHTTSRLIVTTEHEVLVVPQDGSAAERVAADDEMRQAIFLHGGRLAVLTETHLQLYQRDRHAYRLIANQSIPQGRPVRLLSIKADVIGLLFAEGRIERWKHRDFVRGS